MPDMNDYLSKMRWSEVRQTEGYKNGTTAYRDKIKTAWFETRVAPIIPDIPEVKDYAWENIFGEPISQAIARRKKYEGEERLSAQAVTDPSSVRTPSANVAQFVRGVGQSIQVGGEGTVGAMAKTPELLERSVYDTTMAPWNLMSRMIGRPDWQGTYESMIRPTSLSAKLADTVAAPHFKSQKEILDRIGQQKSILEELKQGNISGAAKALVYGFFQNAPQLALSSAIAYGTGSPQSAMYTMAATSGAQQLNQLNTEHPGMSSGSKTANAMANGALEGIFESLGTVKILDQFLNTSAKKELFKEGTQRAMTRFLKEFAKGSWQEGPMEEAPTQLTQNLNDIAFGLKPATWDNLFNGVFDASAIGAVSGGAMSGGLSLLQGSGSGATDAGTPPPPPSGNLEISPEDQVAIQQKFLQSHGINIDTAAPSTPTVDEAIQSQMKALPAPEQPLLIEQNKQGAPLNIDTREAEYLRDQIKDHLRQILRDHPESAQTITAYEDYLDAVYEKNPGAMYQAYKGVTEMPLEAFLPTGRYSGNDISPERAESLYRSITNKLLDIKKNEPKLKDRVDYYWERVKELKDADPRRLVRIYDDLSRIQYVSRTEFSVRPGAPVVGATIQTPGESAAGSPNEAVPPAGTPTLADAVKAADMAVSPEAVNQTGLAAPEPTIPQQGVSNGEAQVQTETAPEEGRQEEGLLIPIEQKVSPPSAQKPVPQSAPSTEKGGNERVEGKPPSKSVDKPSKQPKKKSAPQENLLDKMDQLARQYDEEISSSGIGEIAREMVNPRSEIELFNLYANLTVREGDSFFPILQAESIGTRKNDLKKSEFPKMATLLRRYWELYFKDESPWKSFDDALAESRERGGTDFQSGWRNLPYQEFRTNLEFVSPVRSINGPINFVETEDGYSVSVAGKDLGLMSYRDAVQFANEEVRKFREANSAKTNKKPSSKLVKPASTPKETLPTGVVRTKEVGNAMRVGYDNEGKPPSKSVDKPAKQPKKKSTAIKREVMPNDNAIQEGKNSEDEEKKQKGQGRNQRTDSKSVGEASPSPKETLPAGVVRTKEVGGALRVGYDNEGKPVAAGKIVKGEEAITGKAGEESAQTTEKIRRIVSQVRSLLPEAELLVFDRLIVKNMSKGVSHLNGAYLEGVILLDQDPGNTTGYHEVFHGYLDMFTSPQRRAALFQHFRKDTGLIGATDDDIEEVLARDFAQYALSKGGAKPKNFVQRFYEQVKRFIQHLLGRLDLVKSTYDDILSLRRAQTNPYADMTGRGETILGEILNGTARAKKETKDPALEDFLPHYPAGAMAFGHGLYFDSVQQMQDAYNKASVRPGSYNGPGKLSNPEFAKWEETLSGEQKSSLVGAMNKAKAAGIFSDIPEEAKATQKYSLPGSRTISWDSPLSEIYSLLSENLNGDTRASEMLAEIGIDGHTVKMPSGGEQIVIYSKAVSSVLSRLQSLNMKPLSDAQRKKMTEFNPSKEELRQTGKEVVGFVNDLAVPLERYLENLSSSLVSTYGKGIRSFDYLVNKFSNQRKIKLRPWVIAFRAMARKSLPDAKRYSLALFNGDIATVLELNRKYKIDPKTWASVKGVLNEMIEQAREVGYSVEYLHNYFPRFVKYKQAFLEALESGNQGFISQTLNAYMKAKGLTVLTDDEKIQAISQILNMYHDHLTNGKPSSFQQRQIRYIDEIMIEYYYDPVESVLRYVNHVTQAIETRRFFGGKQEAAKGEDEAELLDNTLDMLSEYRSEKVLNENIARYINELMKSGEIVAGQEEETIRHLRAKFGYRGIGGIPAMMRNLGVVLILNNIGNAFTQVCDIAYSLYRPGGARIAPVELIKAISRRSEITKEKLGIDRIMEEFVIQGRLGKLADKVMTGSLLRTFDRIGKQTLANTVISSMREDAKSGKFKDKNWRLLSRSFDNSQLPEVIDDLKSGRLSDKVLFLAYNAIADVQALTNSQTPLYYSTLPPLARLAFQFKTFTVVQVNFIRNESIDLIRKGKVKEGMANLVWLGTLFLMLGASTRWLKDLLFGRPIHVENYMLETLLNIFGVNRYQFYKAAEVIDKDQPEEALTLLASSTIAPSVTPLIQMGIDAGRVIRHLADKVAGKAGKTLNMADLKSMQFVPLVGQYIYWNWGGGPARIDKKEIKALKDDLEKLYNLPINELTDKKRREISEKEDRLYELLEKQQQKQIEESDRQQEEIDATDNAEQEE